MIFIYLDFDGVLNNETMRELDQFFRYDQDCASNLITDWAVPPSVQHAIHKLSIANILQFKRALHWLEDLCPQLVISSSWRKTMTMEEMQSLMAAIGIEPTRVHSFTPQTSQAMEIGFCARRAFEIRDHMRYHGLQLHEIAIVDDMRLFDLKAPELERFLHVSCWNGFNATSANDLVQLFKPEWKPHIRFLKSE